VTFKLDGGVENLLALTPVLAEWHRRNGGSVLVETRFPRVFWNNPDVEVASERIGQNDMCLDMDMIPWPSLAMNVTELYASRVLGDTLMRSWKTFMVSTEEEKAEALAMRPKGKVAAYCVDVAEIPADVDLKMRAVLEGRGYVVRNVTGMSLGLARAVIEDSELFVGTDGPIASVSFTTDVPAVVCYTWRDSYYFSPYRREIAFEPLVHGDKVCDDGRICLAKNGFHELGKVYGHKCPKNPEWVCRTVPFDEMMVKALDRIEARA
jgi:hypothetical protein